MLPYYMLFAVPTVYLGIMYSLKNVDRKKANTQAMIIFFSILALMLVLRHEKVGSDITLYLYRFETLRNVPFSGVFSFSDMERGYLVFSWLLSKVIHDPQVFIAVVSLIIIIPIAYLYVKESENTLLGLSIFVLLPVFCITFSGIRQAIAMSITVFAFYFVKHRKPLWFIASVFLAVLFHQSAAVVLLIYPIYHLRIKKQNFWLFVPFIGIIYVFNAQIFNFILRFMGEKYQERYSELESTGAYSMIILFILFALYSFIVVDEEKMDYETLGLRNVMLLAVSLQLFAPIHHIAMRMNYYYLMFLPICMSRVVCRCRDCDKKINDIIVVCMCLFFLWYYFNNAHGALYTNVSLHIYPYAPFWQEGFGY